ncbi:exported hypothetical protein [Candidatus Magnetomoraceae bacterium gMMP-1]
MKSIIFKLIGLMCLTFFAACAGPELSYKPLPLEDTAISYGKAVRALGMKLENGLNRLEEINWLESGEKSFLIYNKDAQNGEECELARRFIEDLSDYLVNRRIHIKRKELVTWTRATQGNRRVKCSEVLESLASNFFIEFSLKECADSNNCMEARARIIAAESNDIRFTAKKTFSLKNSVAKWYRQKYRLPRLKGSRENPYSDYNDAANSMVGRISCILKKMMDYDNVILAVGKTDNTPPDIALAFSQSISDYGLEQVISHDKWLPVAIRTGDQFELGIYRKKHRELFEKANAVLALHIQKQGRKFFLRANLLALESIEIKDRTIIKAGTNFPYCVATGYVLSHSIENVTISAIGTGICNKNWNRTLWPETAKRAAKLDAERKLAEKLGHTIRSKETYLYKRLDSDRMESMLRAYIKNARIIWEKYDKRTCKAEVKMEVERENIKSLSHDSNRDYDTYVSSRNPIRNTGKKIFENSYKHAIVNTDNSGQTAMLRNIQQELHNRLHEDGISAIIINFIILNGRIGQSDCRKEKHYLAPKGVPSRRFCEFNYDLRLIMQDREVFYSQKRARGMGSNINTAREDAVLSVVNELYPLISDLAFTMSEKKTIRDLHRTLMALDNEVWNFSNDFDTDSVLDFIEQQIETL